MVCSTHMKTKTTRWLNDIVTRCEFSPHWNPTQRRTHQRSQHHCQSRTKHPIQWEWMSLHLLSRSASDERWPKTLGTLTAWACLQTPEGHLVAIAHCWRWVLEPLMWKGQPGSLIIHVRTYNAAVLHARFVPPPYVCMAIVSKHFKYRRPFASFIRQIADDDRYSPHCKLS